MQKGEGQGDQLVRLVDNTGEKREAAVAGTLSRRSRGGETWLSSGSSVAVEP